MGKTTSTVDRISAASASGVAATPVTSGSRPSAMVSVSGSTSARNQDPSRAMPTGTTSNRAGSRWRRMLPADTHEMACSELRPP